MHRARESSLRVAQILDAGRPNSKHVWKPALGLVGVFSLVCIAVVPSAPKFVAFSVGRTTSFDNVHSVALNRSQFSSSGIVPARVVPASTIQASMRASAVPILEKRSKPLARRVVESSPERKPEQRHTASEVVSARLDANAKPSGVNVVKTSASDAAVPREALFVIRTAQQIGPNSWVWSVTVWDVKWASPAQEGIGKIPVANKT